MFIYFIDYVSRADSMVLETVLAMVSLVNPTCVIFRSILASSVPFSVASLGPDKQNRGRKGFAVFKRLINQTGVRCL